MVMIARMKFESDPEGLASKAPAKYWSELLTRVGTERDRKAFEAVHAHFAPLIRGFLQMNAGGMSNEFADELAQEVMIKVWFKAKTYDASKAAASTWIFTLARNARIDYLRKYARQDAQTDTLLTEDIWDEDSGNQPFVYLYQNRAEKQVQGMLGKLPTEQRNCLHKVFMEGKSHSEIAQELDLPLGTVKSRVRLGLKKLQNGLGLN